ncbi:hypothetical protein E4T56_gene9800 [Termitomyces sp. T112]|nr:hypothetical protein E4T56_gene9800 [Termitomyces sp. T112]
MSTTSGHIFNVPEAHGKEAVELETTAAAAQIQAPTAEIAREVEENAEHVHDVAQDAANVARHKGPALTGAKPSAADKLQQEASAKTNAAVIEGQQDVDALKAAGAGYVEQAKEIVDKAISTAQSCLPDSVGGEAGTTQEVLEKAKGAVQGAFGTAGTAANVPSPSTPSSSTGIPATSAPLESGLKTVNTPYPATTTSQAT